MNLLRRIFWKPQPVVNDVWASPFNESLEKVVAVRMNDWGDVVVSTARWIQEIPGFKDWRPSYGIAMDYPLRTWQRRIKEQRRFVSHVQDDS